MKVAVEDQAYRNKAFICYSDDDKDFAIRLEKALKRYKPVKNLGIKNTSLNVFRDTPDLNETEYAELIYQNLESSHKLIVICSPNSKTNDVVNERIRHFAARSNVNNIIPVVVNSNPNSGFDIEPDNIQDFPPALCEVRDIGLIARYDGFDIRKNDLENGNYALAWYTLLSCLFEINRSEIALEEKRRQHVQNRRKMAAILNGILLAFIVLFVTILWQRVETDRIARTKLAKGFWEQSKISVQENDLLKSLQLLAHAISLQPQEELRKELFSEFEKYQPVSRLAYIIRHDGEILGAKFNKNQTRILTWSDDHTAKIWDARNGQLLINSIRHNGPVYGADFIESESNIITWSADGSVQIWDAKTGRPLKNALKHGSSITGTALNQEENRLATWGEDFSIRVWDLESGQKIGKTAGHDGWINGVLFFNDDSRLISWSDDSTASAWNPDTGEKIGRTMFHPAEVNGAILNSDESQLLTWCSDGSIQLRDVKTGKPRRFEMRHNGSVLGAIFSRNEDRILSWGRDNVSRVWHLKTGKEMFPPLQHEGWVFGAAFNPYETRILTWSFDNSARLWDAQTGEQLGFALQHGSGPSGSDAGIFGAGFDTSGRRVFTWGDDNTGRLWEAKTSRQLGTPFQHNNFKNGNYEVKGAIYNDDMTRIFTWSNDSTGRFWIAPNIKPVQNKPNNIASDPDFPLNHFKLQVNAITGTYLDSLTHNNVYCLAPESWQELNDTYQKIAQEHYLKCNYPNHNLWSKLYPEDAAKIRPLP